MAEPATKRRYNRNMRPGEYVEGCECGHCVATQQKIRMGMKPWDGRLRNRPANKLPLKKESKGQPDSLSGNKIIEFPRTASLMGETDCLMGETNE